MDESPDFTSKVKHTSNIENIANLERSLNSMYFGEIGPYKSTIIERPRFNDLNIRKAIFKNSDTPITGLRISI